MSDLSCLWLLGHHGNSSMELERDIKGAELLHPCQVVPAGRGNKNLIDHLVQYSPSTDCDAEGEVIFPVSHKPPEHPVFVSPSEHSPGTVHSK